MVENITKVQIKTPSRLHFTLIDLNGALGRIDGGLGVALEEPNWVIKIQNHPKWVNPPIIEELLNNLRRKMKILNKYKIEFDNTLEEHVGLGSQTQLSLAIAQGISLLEGKKYHIQKLAKLVDRGGTSGIGVAAFKYGGFILDGGHAISEKTKFLPSHFSSAQPALVVHRLKVPSDWYFVVAIPDIGKGKHGTAEVEIFNKYCPIPNSEVEKISRIILMQILPALIENDIENFGSGLNSIQKLGFKRVENELQGDFVAGLQEFFMKNGAAGTGLSSFGPATFCVLRGKKAAEKLSMTTNEYLIDNGYSGTVFFSKVKNSGVEIKKL